MPLVTSTWLTATNDSMIDISNSPIDVLFFGSPFQLASQFLPNRGEQFIPKSSYRRGGLAPRCRLIASWGWSRSQGLGCSPIKAVRELGLERRTSGELKKTRSALVVDDVSDVTEMLSFLLTHAGYEVSTASSAPAAIELARDHLFDVVISDIGMPEMNGYELVEALRALPGYDTVPIVAVTGYSIFDDRDRSLAAGFNEHITKPIEPRAFLDLIEQL